MFEIVYIERERIAKDDTRLFEADLMLPKISSRFHAVPHKVQHSSNGPLHQCAGKPERQGFGGSYFDKISEVLNRLAFVPAIFAILSGCAGARVPMDDAVVSYGGKLPDISAETRPNDAPPHIQAVWISGKTFKGGDLVRIRVTASTNVAVVEMRTFSGG